MAPKVSVGVVGAGVSGVVAAVHLKVEGADITVFERAPVAGGVWVFDERLPPEPAYPSENPSEADFTALTEEESWRSSGKAPSGTQVIDDAQNNVPTELMKLKVNSWPPDTPPHVRHSVLAKYIQNTADKYHVSDSTLFDTRVDHVSKSGAKWKVQTTTLQSKDSKDRQKITRFWEFDKLVIATGHYHACKIPDLPGLTQWKTTWPSRVQHSKSYRNAKKFKDKIVLLVGASVSSTDIAKELGLITKKVYQVSRGGVFDLPTAMLPPNGTRVGAIASFSTPTTASASEPLAPDAPIPGTVTLESGEVLHDVDYVILCTGYHMSLPFLRDLHADSTPPTAAGPAVLVTDGTQMHNLHLDIFYVPDPSLAFVGVPYHIATFSFFEYQAIAVARVFVGRAALPSREEMRRLYDERVRAKGVGKVFHSLRGAEESDYVDRLLEWINQDGRQFDADEVQGHSPEWRQAKAALLAKTIS
ncbi:MAG: hypothetical protein M1818_002180 [Claussenomyces sp. TS43310]|nr:MAG: hypothetical protein M1818_002180 [Claussenomyces sp. TS43310]